MPFVQAKCPNCGGILAVDASHEAAVCQYCNTPFITEKAINNVNITNYVTANNVVIENQDKGFDIRYGILVGYHGESADIKIPNNVTEIANSVFSRRPIRSLSISDSVKTIGKEAFSDCELLESVFVSSSVEYIAMNAFSYCKRLATLDFDPNCCATVGKYAFCNCYSLKKVLVPSGVTLNERSFSACASLTEFRWSGLNAKNADCVAMTPFGAEYFPKMGLCRYCGSAIKNGLFGSKCSNKYCSAYRNYTMEQMGKTW